MRYIYAFMWIFLILEGIFFAPAQIDTERLWNMVVGQYEGINPALVSLFMMMGLHPLLCAAYLWEYKSKPSYIPFCVGSFFLGCFVLLPFLFFRSIQHRQASLWTSNKVPCIAIAIGFSACWSITKGTQCHCWLACWSLVKISMCYEWNLCLMFCSHKWFGHVCAW